MRQDVRESLSADPVVAPARPRPPAAIAAPRAAALARFADTTPAARAAAMLSLQGTLPNRQLARLAQGRVLARDTATENWKKAGPFGDEIYKLLAEQLTAKELASLLESVPDKAGEAAGGIESKAVDLTGKESAALAKGGAQWATKAAAKWLKTPSGQAFLNGARKHLGDNADVYYALLANLAINAVQNGYALYMAGKLDPPNLEKSLKLGPAEVTGGVDLGKKGDPVQGVTAGFALGGYGVGYKYAFDPEKGATHTGEAKAEIVKKALIIKASTAIRTQGTDTVSLGVAGAAGGFDYKADATLGLDDVELTKLTLHLGYKNKDDTLRWLADFSYAAAGADGKGQTVAARMALTKVIKGYALDIDVSGQIKDGSPSASLVAAVMIPLPHDFRLVPQLGVSYGMVPEGPAKGGSEWMVAPGLGLGHKDMPVMPTVSVGVTGSGDAVPMIGISGRFKGL